MSLTITSKAFADRAEIPRRHTCDGDDVSPPLAWTGVPDACRSLALIVDDPDAPDPAAPKMVFVHWVVYNLPPDSGGLAEGAALPAGAVEGRTDFGKTGYGGPCPPVGSHRYFFKLYALDVVLPDLGPATKDQLLAAIDGHVLEQAELVGLYRR